MGFVEYAADAVIAPYTKVEVDHPEIVATDSKGCVTGKVMDFCKILKCNFVTTAV